MMETMDIAVGGMTCGGCVRSVTTVLKGLPGTQQVDVELSSAQARVRFDPNLLNRKAIADAIIDAGYEVGPS